MEEKVISYLITFLFTKNASYKIKESIIQIGKKFENNQQFLKTHRSCIINVSNVDYVDLKSNTIYLKKYSISLLTKENKELLKKLLKNNQIVK